VSIHKRMFFIELQNPAALPDGKIHDSRAFSPSSRINQGSFHIS